MVQEVGHVESIEYRETGTYIQARVPQALANRLEPFYVNHMEDESSLSESQSGNNNEDDEIDWVAIGRGRHTAKNM